MPSKKIILQGRVVPGYRVASQKSREYPYGTIERQKPFFKKLGLDLQKYYSGTINISIAPFTFSMRNPEYTFRQVEWTDLHPPEDFSFSRCTVLFKGKRYAGMIYYPHPETKKRHFENASILEILAVFIPDLSYGDSIEVKMRANEIEISPVIPSWRS